MRKLFLFAAIMVLAFSVRIRAAEEISSVYESPDPPVPAGELDRIVFTRLSDLGIQPVLCSDAVFVRRAYLDVIGTLPTATEARQFLEDSDVQKRSKLIETLLARDEYADYWSMKWGDTLRIKAEFPVNLWPNAAQAYHRWVRASLVDNKPYDQFVREMLTSSGSNFRVGPVNFYRAIQNKTPEGIATAVALTFMGARAESWPPETLAGMAVFFSQVGYKPSREWKEELVFWDPLGTSRAKAGDTAGDSASDAIAGAQPIGKPHPLSAVFPDGTKIELAPDRDPREVFADWLITPENPWFMRSIVNRVWAWLLGRGIIDEPDDIRDDNPPSNPELLAYLVKELVDSGYDLKHLYRLILNSRTYQLSSMPRFSTPEAAANFASYPLRRLDAEVLIDAINEITGTTDLYTSAIPEPFTYIPQDVPAIALADGSITSTFLTMFGRSARATGMADERNNKPVAAQWLHMLNSSHIQQKLTSGPKLRQLAVGRKPEEILDELYLTVLSRFPTDEERSSAQEYLRGPSAGNSPPPGGAAGTANGARRSSKAARQNAAGKAAPKRYPGRRGPAARIAAQNQRDAWLDIVWALINSTEFLYRH